MKKLFLFIILLFGFTANAQNPIAQLKFEDAEKAFNRADYTTALKYLDETEELVGVTSKTLYLRIVIENKQFNNGAFLYQDEKSYDALTQIRKDAAAYLKALSKQPIDDRYREIYNISEELKKFPLTREMWEKEYAERKEKVAKEEEERRQQEEAVKREEKEMLDLYERNKISPVFVRHIRLSDMVKGDASGYATVYLIKDVPQKGRLSGFKTDIFFQTSYIVDIARRNYTEIKISQGIAKFNVRSRGNTRNFYDGTIMLDAKENETYYIMIHTTEDAADMYLLNEQEGKRYVEKYKFIPLKSNTIRFR